MLIAADSFALLIYVDCYDCATLLMFSRLRVDAAIYRADSMIMPARCAAHAVMPRDADERRAALMLCRSAARANASRAARAELLC